MQLKQQGTPATPLLIGGTALSIALLGLLAADAFGAPRGPVAIWPPAGIAFTVVYLYGIRALPGVLLGAAVVNLNTLSQTVTSPSSVLVLTLLLSMGAAAQALFAAIVVRRFLGDREPLMRPARISKFILLSGVLSPLVNSTIGSLCLLGAGMIDSSAFASAWFIWWLGDAMGTICFGPVTLMLAPGQSDAWSGRRLKVVIPTLLSIVISYGVWQFGGISAEDQARRATQQRTQMASVELAYHASSYLRVVKDAAALFAALSNVREKEFKGFAGPVLRDEEEILGLEWLEWVSSWELERFQERQRKDLNLPDYTVWTLHGKPLLHTAAANLHYAPVTFAATQSEFAANLGLDLSSSTGEAAALDQALANGAAMTEPFTTTTGISTMRVVRMVIPVYDVSSPLTSEAERWEHLRGYLTIVLSLDRLLQSTFAQPHWADATIRVTDTTDPDDPVPAALRARATNEGPAASASSTSEVAGRSWTIRLTPGVESSKPPNPYSTRLILLLGLLVAGLLESFLLVATGLERRLEHRVQTSDYAATHDPLTDLINRREFVARLDAARERALQAGLVQVLLFLDLDGFKQVNDTGGHASGDELLQTLAAQMRNAVRQADSVARLGGDEFAVLLPDCPVDRGLEIADDLVRAVADSGVEFEGRRLGVTASVGFVAIEPPEPSSTDELLRQADAACYLAKRSGKSQVRRYEVGIA